MARGRWILAALLAASPVMAAQTEFQGHAMETDGGAVLRVQGKRYAIPGTPAQVVVRAQACLSRGDSGAGVVSSKPQEGRLVAIGRVPFGSHGIAKGRLTLEASDGGFSIAVSDLGIAPAASGDHMDLVFAPVLRNAGSDWEPAVAALIGVEEALVGCLFG